VSTKTKSFTDEMQFSKSTKGTHVFESEALRTIYIPKDVISKITEDVPKRIKVTIEVVE